MPLRSLVSAVFTARHTHKLVAAGLLTVCAFTASAQTASAPAAPIEVRNAQGQLVQGPWGWKAPAAARMEFAVQGKYKNLPYQTKAQMDWLPQGQRYEASQQVQVPLVGIRRQASVGSIVPQGLQPDIFIDRGRKEYSTTFDAQTGQIVFSRGSAAEGYVFINASLEKLSILYHSSYPFA